MSNTLTTIAPILYSAAKEVAAEPVGMLNAINMNFDNKGVAKNDTVRVPVAPTRTISAFTPAAVSTTGTDATSSAVAVTIADSNKVSWHLDGEQIRSLENGGNYQDWVRQMTLQGMRALRNDAEAKAWAEGRKNSTRASGAPATDPFATTVGNLTAARQILLDNGAPMADLQLVIDSAAGTALRNLGLVQNAYQAGSADQLITGQFQPMFGFKIRESAQIVSTTAGTGSGATTNNAGYAVGTTTITLASAGTGTLLAGDYVTFAGDSNIYCLTSGSADVSAGGTITLAAPGLKVAMSAATKAITVKAASKQNLAFERSSIVGVVRPPLIPANATIDQLEVTDSNGMTYLMLDIQQYGQRTMELHLAYGFKAVNPEFISTILA